MEHQLANQEIARLRYAEALRESSRRHAPAVEATVDSLTRIQALVARVRHVYSLVPPRARTAPTH